MTSPEHETVTSRGFIRKSFLASIPILGFACPHRRLQLAEIWNGIAKNQNTKQELGPYAAKCLAKASHFSMSCGVC